MSDDNTSEAPPGETVSAAAGRGSAPNELEILGGGVEIEVAKIDGSTEKVKVRQLPIRLVPEWGQLQGNESALVELLCDRADKTTLWNLNNERAVETRLLQILSAAPFEQIEVIEKRLIQTRAAIAKLEEKAHWSDSLTEESVIEIVDHGERLNRPRFGRWTKRAQESIGRRMKEAKDALASASSPPLSSSS